MKKLLFENGTCSRCGGSGKYSYCQSYGHTCFKCRGAGVTLTKKGAAAQAWLSAKRKKLGNAFAVGEWILVEGVPGYTASKWATVTEVLGSGQGHQMLVTFKNGEKTTLNGFGENELRTFVSKEWQENLVAEALAFQATLTKSGTVMKRAAKAAPAEAVAA